MQPLSRHHHFRLDDIQGTNRLARLETAVVQHLRNTTVTDAERESSIDFELKHSAGVTQFGRMLAQKRELDTELSATGALLHDIFVIVTGKYSDHARQGGPIASQFLADVGSYTAAEKNVIDKIIVNHSDKDVISDDPYVELGKDADVLDCFQYPDALEEYLLVKPLSKVKYYFARGKALWAEFGMVAPDSFHMLDTYSDSGWLVATNSVSSDQAAGILSVAASDTSMHPFAMTRRSDGRVAIYSRDANISQAIGRDPGELPGAISPIEHLRELETILIWPGLQRYHVLNKLEAKAMAIAVDDA